MKEKKSLLLRIRVSPAEYEMIRSKAKISGLSVSEFSRRILTGEKVMAAPDADFPNLIREVKRVGSNLNQLLRKLNIVGIAHPLELERCEQDIQKTIEMLYRTFRPGKGAT